ncbi:MAG: hypothetical protein IRY99_23875, partial [Isosphaeraceae bacterium]|nr:hypothetical protein [Isosphaeraceae bacterium]
MPIADPLPKRLGPAVAVAALTLIPAALAAAAAEVSSPAPWIIVDRTITQDRGTWHYWQIDYTLRNDGAAPLVIPPSEVQARVRGWVSNSRVAVHATPRLSDLTISGPSGLSAAVEVVPSRDHDRRCRERAVLQAWPGHCGDNPPDPRAEAAVGPVTHGEPPTLMIGPGAELRLRLRLEHEHLIYGPYDPLLGPRDLELHLGPAILRDTLPLDHATRWLRPEPSWPPPPPADRLDRCIY